MARRYPAQLSGGQRQRVGVARALAADPPLMLMDEPFGAIDPINRERLQNEFLRLQAEIRKTIVFVTHDIDEAIKMGDRIAILQVGGTLAQYAPPAELLLHPAERVRGGLRRRRPRAQAARAAAGRATCPRDALGSANGGPDIARRRCCATRSATCSRTARCTAASSTRDGDALGSLTVETLARLAPGRDRVLAQLQIRERAAASASCVERNGFCPDWIADNWERYKTPLIEHIELTLVSVAIGFVIAFALALLAHRRRWLIAPITQITGILYTLPSVAVFFLLLPLTGRGKTTAIIALVAYTLLIIFRNVITGLEGVPAEARDAAAAWA